MIYHCEKCGWSVSRHDEPDKLIRQFFCSPCGEWREFLLKGAVRPVLSLEAVQAAGVMGSGLKLELRTAGGEG